MSVSTDERCGRAGERDDESSSPSRPGPRADDGPSPRPSRRSFSPEYKLGIVAEYEAALLDTLVRALGRGEEAGHPPADPSLSRSPETASPVAVPT